MPYKLVRRRFHNEAKDNVQLSSLSPRSRESGSDDTASSNIQEKGLCESIHSNYGTYLKPLDSSPTSRAYLSGERKCLSSRRRDGNETGKNVETFKNALSLYDSEKRKVKREKSFLEKYTALSSDTIKEKKKQQSEKEYENLKEKNRIHGQLKKIRTEFAFCKAMRVTQQYVTPKVLEHEKPDRETFQNIRRISEHSVIHKPKLKKIKPKIVVDEEKIKERGKIVHCKHLFDIRLPGCLPPVRPPFNTPDKTGRRNGLLSASQSSLADRDNKHPGNKKSESKSSSRTHSRSDTSLPNSKMSSAITTPTMDQKRKTSESLED